MKRTTLALATIAAIAAMLLYSRPSVSQEGKIERFNVPLTDPSKPVRLNVSLVTGAITVEAHGGNSVVIEAVSLEPPQGRKPASKDGLRRIPASGAGMEIEEENNTVTVGSSTPNIPINLRIQVPVQTSLRLSTVNGGDIRVTGVRGEHELSNTNGAVEARQVAGSVVTHTINGQVLVTFTSVSPDKAMAFSTLNGDIDVTFPGNTRANLRMESQNGDIYTDFDVAMRDRAVEDKGERSGGRYRVTVERAVSGSINGGGPEIRFKTFNGDVHLRRAGS
ncbi:MAG TPA: DUF4097 family beta strand repeat-containing protein [Thermoanaerobaculia bacterium]|jgi:hypothetical protein|nr:DUF4097 family beta strand repeat-containing protein [Thermoanaerobaculia bacterium]